jgi:hypothetical protein
MTYKNCSQLLRWLKHRSSAAWLPPKASLQTARSHLRTFRREPPANVRSSAPEFRLKPAVLFPADEASKPNRTQSAGREREGHYGVWKADIERVCSGWTKWRIKAFQILRTVDRSTLKIIKILHWKKNLIMGKTRILWGDGSSVRKVVSGLSDQIWWTQQRKVRSATETRIEKCLEERGCIHPWERAATTASLVCWTKPQNGIDCVVSGGSSHWKSLFHIYNRFLIKFLLGEIEAVIGISVKPITRDSRMRGKGCWAG